jgi:F-type H+-transporting ATPase subunit delta
VPVAERIYARALFDAAKQAGRLEPVAEELTDFVESVREVPELRALLENPQIEPRSKVAALQEILGGADELVRNFLLLITERGRGGQLEGIARELERLVAIEQGRLEVELTTAYELSDEEARGIVHQIEQASGRSVDATRSVDPELIGGLVLQAGSMRVDASVRGRLERLRRELLTHTT